ncbi:UNVERIFIED_CONTAM: hypothetical protein Sradi_0158900 [Sesamum radiatum]|uniref:Uncharacterized protein n=1 Tax=Sesamum radiatum TaxID=300843 RepID=A0AAW2WQ02_SESRA
MPRSTNLGMDIPRIIVPPNAPPVELSLGLLGTIRQMIALAIHEQLAVLVPTRVTTPPPPRKVTAPKQTNPVPALHRPNVVEGPST